MYALNKISIKGIKYKLMASKFRRKCEVKSRYFPFSLCVCPAHKIALF